MWKSNCIKVKSAIISSMFHFFALLILLGSVNVFAGTSSKFDNYIKKNYTNKYGKISSSSYKKMAKGYENYMKKKGVISSVVDDFDGNGSTECIVFYILEKQAPNTTSRRKSSYVYADLLVSSGNKIKKSSTIKLYSLTQFYSTDLRVYLNESNSKHYIALQLLYCLAGVPSDIAIIGIKNNRFYSELVLWDPGYTSGQALYKYDNVKKISNMNFYTENNSTRLYYDSDVNLAPLGDLMNAELKKYAMKVTWQKPFIIRKGKNWMIKASNSTRKIFSIIGDRVDHTGSNPSTTKNTFSIKIDIPVIPQKSAIELSGYLGKSMNYVIKKFPGGVDSGWLYVYKTLEFADDENTENFIVRFIAINSSTEYSILGLTCGMSKSEAEAILSGKGWKKISENYHKNPKEVDCNGIFLTYKNGYLVSIEYGSIN